MEKRQKNKSTEKEGRELPFPVFIRLNGKRVLIVGAGKVAQRRVCALLPFGVHITVVAPEVSEILQRYEKEGKIEIKRKRFTEQELGEQPFAVLAATDEKELNRNIALLCRKRGIFVNNASDASMCDFYFPALAKGEGIVAGVCGDGNDHRKVAQTAEKIRRCLEREDESNVFKTQRF
ncbi:precorrin-2 dehydrogenase/sirohydrochlorin ferrochelatase family protein [Lachnoclostridium sp. An181]|uniref:precorrin-2 dehydrogenase/sirohydrochlorin ferrochelatase family protein n=1 Tax=Lachnoclostridium sp. An181 TaxID=1965575 RepID=UPI001FA8A9E8|nr:bifunctional precorrin-2 dehydrogenase/sirohydrochlorin ferrochelatase [Lachnoclostridium sp. An181]